MLKETLKIVFSEDSQNFQFDAKMCVGGELKCWQIAAVPIRPGRDVDSERNYFIVDSLKAFRQKFEQDFPPPK